MFQNSKSPHILAYAYTYISTYKLHVCIIITTLYISYPIMPKNAPFKTALKQTLFTLILLLCLINNFTCIVFFPKETDVKVNPITLDQLSFHKGDSIKFKL